ncbi:MAG: hypothetical protein PHY54_17045 [Methylococcales bacterium]|nr:hypothetical protein [Methylococcales bacterium]
MKTIIDYLDDLKEKTGSDYKSAKLLKTNQSSISTIRKRSQCGDETAVKMADLLGINQSEVLIAAAIARSEGDVKSAWERISKMTGIAASVLLAVLITLPNISYSDIDLNNDSIIYIMRSAHTQPWATAFRLSGISICPCWGS